MNALPAEQQALLRAVVADPDADTPRLVYADWLDENDDPTQADYVRQSVRLFRLPADDPERVPLAARLTAVLREHADRWAEALGRPAGVTRHYRRGFVHTLRYRSLTEYFDLAGGWFEAAPVEGLDIDLQAHAVDAGWAADWERFVRSPDLARLRVLTLRELRVDDLVWNELFRNPDLAGLRRLNMLDCGWNGNELYDLSRYPHLAELEVLDLGNDTDDRVANGLRVALGSLHLAGLRAIYFGHDWGIDRELAARLTARCGQLWGSHRPPGPTLLGRAPAVADAMTPRQIVAELDKYIVGQGAAKKAVAVAIRNRWRRQQMPEDMRKDVTPKNIILIGPTGVGKTEIARRLAQLVSAPFVKVEATKFTEVGYVGRDVESIIRDLTEAAAGLVKTEMRDQVREKAKDKVTDRLLDLLVPPVKTTPWEPDQETEEEEKRARTREKMRAKLEAGELEDRPVELSVEQRAVPVQIFSNMGMENMDVDLQSMFDRIMPKGGSPPRQMTVREARKVLVEQETEALIDRAAVAEQAVAKVQDHGIVFLDEIDKVCGPQSGSGPDVSRQGVQRDLLPVVEGTTVNTKYGPVKTDHVLFIAAGAFHVSKPADLMPELQGRFPIRVELTDLTRDDLLRVLTEPKHALTKQYAGLLKTEGVELVFTPDGVEALADTAWEVNRTAQNIGARRLHTILEKVVEEVSFDGPDLPDKRVVIDAGYVKTKLGPIVQRDDLTRFIL